jgi:hypothetical protein
MAHIASTNVAASVNADGDMPPVRKTLPARRAIRALATGVAAATLLTGALATSSLAEDAHINEMIFDVKSPYQKATINVSSSDGAKWDTIQPGQLAFWAHRKVDTRHPGYVEQVGIFLGKCTNTGCANNSLIQNETVLERDYDRAGLVSFSTDKLRGGIESIFGTPYSEEILRRCNMKLQPDGATKPHSFLFAMSASFSANTRRAQFESGFLPPEVTGGEPAFNGGDATRHGAFLTEVKCHATSKATAGDKPDPKRTKVTATDLDLFLATIVQPASSGHGPSGTQCKPLKVTTRLTTDKAGAKNVKLWRQVNGGPITSEVKQMHAAAQGGGKFGDDWVKSEHFTKTTTVQYKAEVLGGTFEPSTPWKSITIHCNGDLASPTSDANPDNGKPGSGKPGTSDPGKPGNQGNSNPGNGNQGNGKPQQGEPRVPTVVAPVCVGGIVANGDCTCPRTHTLVKKGNALFHCVKTAVVPDKPAVERRPQAESSAPKVLVGPRGNGGAGGSMRAGNADQRRFVR